MFKHSKAYFDLCNSDKACESKKEYFLGNRDHFA